MLRKLSILFIVFLLVFPLGLSSVEASSSHTFDTFNAGTPDSNIEINKTPGEITLKENVNTLTKTTKAEFDEGSFFGVKSTNTSGGEVSSSNNYSYFDIFGITAASDSFYDVSLNHLFIATYGQGLFVIDTKGTQDYQDDEIFAHYTTTTIPALSSDTILHVIYDGVNELIYIVSSDVGDNFTPITVISKGILISQSDDTIVKTYSTDGCNGIVSFAFNETLGAFYYGTICGGVGVINRNGTPTNYADDTNTQGVYNWDSVGETKVANRRAYGIYVDEVNQNIYFSTGVNVGTGGLTVISTGGTVATDNDINLGTYNTASNVAVDVSLPQDYIYKSHYDDTSGLIFVEAYSGAFSIIDTHKTLSQVDDDLLINLTIASSPSIPANIIDDFEYEPVSGNLYICSGGELIALDTNKNNVVIDYTVSGSLGICYSFIIYLNNLNSVFLVNGTTVQIINENYLPLVQYTSPRFNVDTTPNSTFTFNPNNTVQNSSSVQFRSATADYVWLDEFDDGDATNLTDYYSYGYAFESVIESGNIVTLKTPTNNGTTYMYLNSGEVANSFPANSTVTIRIRYVGTGATNIVANIASDDWESNTGNVSLVSGVWNTITLLPDSPFSIIEIDNYWGSGTWNDVTDRIEIDWVNISYSDPANWTSWSSSCNNSYGCALPDLTGKAYFQYKLNLETTDVTIPTVVTDVTLASGYQSTGTYISETLDAGVKSTWDSVNEGSTKPANTSITIQTRGSDNSVDWSAWGSGVPSPTRYFQFKSTLATSDSNLTPILASVTVAYSTYVVPSSSSSSSVSSSRRTVSSSSSSDLSSIVNINLVDQLGNPLVGAKVEIIIGTEIYTAYTDSNGNATFNIPGGLNGDETVRFSYGTNVEEKSLSDFNVSGIGTIQLVLNVTQTSSISSSSLSSSRLSSSNNTSVTNVGNGVDNNTLLLILGGTCGLGLIFLLITFFVLRKKKEENQF